MIPLRFPFAPFFGGLAIAMFCLPAYAVARNGFDLSNATIPQSEIMLGGPPRDGIPSIDAPKFVPTGEVSFLKDGDLLIGLNRGGKARAYPLRILVWHEIVNDTVSGEPVAVTYCPLCGTAMVFNARLEGGRRSFGVSGLLYQSDVLMYDRETESLWSQLKMEAVSGPEVGKKLTLLLSEQMTWKAWREKYPDGEVLSPDTGHHREYGGNAYASYFASEDIMFPVPHVRRELPNKTKVVGIIIDGQSKAYPLDQLPDKTVVRDRLANKEIEIWWDRSAHEPRVTTLVGESLPSVVAFWFAWQAFYPDTELWRP
ncbi:MAG: hypothetical protein Fur0032_15810 [Terrimicrobiaceae bacterium]